MTFKPLDRVGIAARIAQDIPEGWFVNLGIGIPTGVSDHVPLDREVIFHSENGVIGAGPAPEPDRVNPFWSMRGRNISLCAPAVPSCIMPTALRLLGWASGSLRAGRVRGGGEW